MKQLIRRLVPEEFINGYHYVLARLASIWYRHPSREMVVIGVTGTNGKSTTVQFIGRLLEYAGKRVGWTTTASFKVGDHEWVNDKKMTMLGRFQSQRLLREMVQAGCTHAVIETSSQGIQQSRHVGIDYDMAVFTNLTPEHIEAHGGFENYKKAKGKLFEAVDKTIIVNLNDDHAEYFLSFGAESYGGFALESVADVATRLNLPPVIATDIHYEATCTTFTLGTEVIHLKLFGRFNLENTLAAVAVVRALGVDEKTAHNGLESLEPVPGRLERIDEGQPFGVIVDYAYEPGALTAVYEALEILKYKRLIHIVGSAGGGRDIARRKILGEMSAQRDDIVIVANEDPYDEDPWQIINDVADAAAAGGKRDDIDLFRVLDRQVAIDKAIAIAQPGDLVLITGKGSEPVMAVAHGKKVAWDDRVAARSALHKRYGDS